MPDSPTSEPESDFVCDCAVWMRSACTGEPFYKEHEGKTYCVLHFPGEEKGAGFEATLQRKLKNKDFDFGGIWFPDQVSFKGFDFDAPVDFSFATFSGAADFSSAVFRAAADFNTAHFNVRADFKSATFHAEANFFFTTFSLADFSFATFIAATNFRSATFNKEAQFRHAVFRSGAEFNFVTFRLWVYFDSATFITWADFSHGTFTAFAGFRNATFNRSYFTAATFSGAAAFNRAKFNAAAAFNSPVFSLEADFRSADFGMEVNFSKAAFKSAANFSHTIFRDYVRFSGENGQVVSATSSLDLQFARTEKPDRVSFHTIRLHPHWFVNVDATKFDFTNVGWPKITKVDSDSRSIKKEIESLQDKKLPSPHRLLSVACWRLATNAEENHRYPEASAFRYMAMDANRLEHRGGFAFWRLSWWYWLASGYGERSIQALVMLVGILLVCAALYTRVGFARWEPRIASEADVATAKRDDVGAPLRFSRALTYSAAVLTFQRPEPKPATTAAQTVVLFETILGPLQAALLALAIRRKFMR